MNRAGLLLVALSVTACAAYRPPFTQGGPVAPSAPGEATVVFLWPMTSCDPAGYFTVATAGGRFVGNVARGTQLRASLPAGATTFLAWNADIEGTAGASSRETVPVLQADLREGRTYYVRMALGEWEADGPPLPGMRAGTIVTRGRTYTANHCIEVPQSMTSAMIALSPRADAWKELPAWTSHLALLTPDSAAGQAWLDAQREVLAYHVSVAVDRYAGLRPAARKLATMAAEDGVAP